MIVKAKVASSFLKKNILYGKEDGWLWKQN